MYFCRQNLLHSDGHLIGYRYHDANYIAFYKSVSEPLDISSAQAVCTSAFTGAVTAIDGLMTYSSGSFGLDQQGIDWQSVYDAFGMSIVLFATGAGCGIIFNIVRKFRV